MAAPVTRQVSGCAGPILTPTGSDTEPGQPLATAVADLPVLDASGRRVSFGALFRERRAVVVFVRHFLCYVCKEYVEDLAKIPKSFLREADVTLIVIGQSSYHHIEPFCKLTGYSHEIYVDPEREIYKRLGMKRGEEISSSGNSIHFVHRDRNRLDHKPINSVLQLVGVQPVNFMSRPAVIHV
uniref:peroxiredoxin-like 2C isoform X3 n=1 Tax=Myodes glareolus TaxID=447135 RepID=UPI002020FD05|nr:peroxiredoxin-like 2C isoform X3 [Myodes glareolus]